MSVLSLSEVQSTGEPNIGTKTVENIPEEPGLLSEGFSGQQKREKPLHAILDMDVTPMEICSARQILIPEFDRLKESSFGNGKSRGLTSDPCRSSVELPIGIPFIGELLPKAVPPQSLQGKRELRSEQEGNASILKVDSSKLECDNFSSNGFSNMQNSFLKEKLCMDGIRHLENKEPCFSSDSKNGKRVRCGGGGKIESDNRLCDSGKNVIILEDGERNQINKSKGVMIAFPIDNCILSDKSNSHSEDNGFPTKNECKAEKGNVISEDRNSNIQKMEENVHDGEPKNLGNAYLDECQTLPLWIKVNTQFP